MTMKIRLLTVYRYSTPCSPAEVSEQHIAFMFRVEDSVRKKGTISNQKLRNTGISVQDYAASHNNRLHDI